MLKKGEIRKLESKTRQWDESLYKWNKWTSKAWKELKKDCKVMFNWLFFYQPKDSEDKAWHLIEVCIAYVFLLKVFNFI